MNEKNEIFDLIILLTKGAQNKEDGLKCNYNNDEYKLSSCTYLLGQALRQYSKNNGRIFVSKKAYYKWRSLTCGNMADYWYTKCVRCDGPAFENGKAQTLALYKGNSNKPELKCFSKGDKFSYREIFHDEHIIPIASIIEDLKNLKDLSYDSVKNVLDNICVCRILKSEDRSIKNKNARFKCLIKTYEESYLQTNQEPIYLIDWEKIEDDYKNMHCAVGCTACELNKSFTKSKKHRNS